jgi:PAS domain S-box-containing protein
LHQSSRDAQQDLQFLLYSEALDPISNICRLGSGRFPTIISKLCWLLGGSALMTLEEKRGGSRVASEGTQLEQRVKDRFGVLPNFFRLTPANPEISENLWGFAQFAYLDNPLPALFKERLFVYLSRFCEVRYCIARHMGFLVGLGRPSADAQCPVQTVEQVVHLLKLPFARGEELARLFSLCATYEKPLVDLPPADSELECAVFALASHVFLQTTEAPACLDALKALFGTRSQYLILFFAFVRTAHYWTEVHPELSFEDDVKQLLATQQELAEFILNDPEAKRTEVAKRILDELPALREEARQAITLLAAILDSSDDAIVGMRLDGTITTWNKSAEQLFGYTAREAVGKHITLIVPQERFAEETEILSRLSRGERIDHFETVRRSKSGMLLDVSLTISPIKDAAGHIVGASKVSRNITDRKEAAERARRADEGLRLMKAQDQERRHIARELHDTAGQTLAVLGMSLTQLMNKLGRVAPDLLKEGQEVEQLVRQLHEEIRTTSYLLHPPLLDEMGLSSALRLYAQGLSERGVLNITLDVSEHFGRLPADVELAIFRVVQECLTNVHRHSGTKIATIRLLRGNDAIHIEVRDRGKGISPERLAEIQSHSSGVGLRGIRERLGQFLGEMKIESNGSGTAVFATIPIPKHQQSTESEFVRARV